MLQKNAKKLFKHGVPESSLLKWNSGSDKINSREITLRANKAYIEYLLVHTQCVMCRLFKEKQNYQLFR